MLQIHAPNTSNTCPNTCPNKRYSTHHIPPARNTRNHNTRQPTSHHPPALPTHHSRQHGGPPSLRNSLYRNDVAARLELPASTVCLVVFTCRPGGPGAPGRTAWTHACLSPGTGKREIGQSGAWQAGAVLGHQITMGLSGTARSHRRAITTDKALLLLCSLFAWLVCLACCPHRDGSIASHQSGPCLSHAHTCLVMTTPTFLAAFDWLLPPLLDPNIWEPGAADCPESG